MILIDGGIGQVNAVQGILSTLDLDIPIVGLAEENEEKKAGYIALLALTKRVLEACIDVLGFEAPERM